MKNFNLTFILVIAFTISTVAQQAIPVSGGNAQGSGGTSSYTIGQVVFNTFESSTGSVSEGIQQAFEFYTLGVNDPGSTFSLSIYPNPTSEYLMITFNQEIKKGLNYRLFDLNGKLIVKNQIDSNQTLLDLREYASAVYFLNLYKNTTQIQSFKIFKN
jgi:hypothetical protein